MKITKHFLLLMVAVSAIIIPQRPTKGDQAWTIDHLPMAVPPVKSLKLTLSTRVGNEKDRRATELSLDSLQLSGLTKYFDIGNRHAYDQLAKKSFVVPYRFVDAEISGELALRHIIAIGLSGNDYSPPSQDEIDRRIAMALAASVLPRFDDVTPKDLDVAISKLFETKADNTRWLRQDWCESLVREVGLMSKGKVRLTRDATTLGFFVFESHSMNCYFAVDEQGFTWPHHMHFE